MVRKQKTNIFKITFLIRHYNDIVLYMDPSQKRSKSCTFIIIIIIIIIIT